MDSQNHHQQDAHTEPFTPETVDEQIDELLITVHASEEQPAMSDAQFVQQVNEVASEYSAIRDRVRERLLAQIATADVLPQPIETSKDGRTDKKRSSSRERVPLMLQDSLYPKRTGIQRLSVLAAACVMALVVGSLLLVLSLSHRPNTQTGGAVLVKTPITVARHTVVPLVQTFCDKRDLGWYSICSNQEEQVLNLKKTVGNNVFTIQTVYADINRVILTYTDTSPVTGNHLPNMANFTLTMQKGIALSQMGDAGSFNAKLGQYDAVASFDTAQVPVNVNTLNLHLQASLYGGMDHHLLGGFSTVFSVPLHAGRVTTWNQTETVNGIAITLHRVVVSPSQTRLYVLSPKLQLGDTQHSPYTLAVGNWNNNAYGFDNESLITQEGNVGSFIGVRLIANTPLFNQQGEWTFTITSGAVIGGSGIWIFHFTVPN